MDFKDQIKRLGEKVLKLRDQIQTEEATKNAFIMPFIHALGYDIFNPEEVIPEFIADIGIKKGEKVDYAIQRNGMPVMLIECKWCNDCLDVYSSQLFRYFHTTQSRFALLTNGVSYLFYTDLVEPISLIFFALTGFDDFTVLAPQAHVSITTSSSPTLEGFHSAPMHNANISSHSGPSKEGLPFVESKYTISLPKLNPKSFGNLFKGYGGLTLSTVRKRGDFFSSMTIRCIKRRFILF